jgi:hypothetical protein
LGAGLRLDMHDKGRAHHIARLVIAGFRRFSGQAVSFSMLVSSCSWIGPSGMTVEIACL